jgi:hypothetical protein
MTKSAYNREEAANIYSSLLASQPTESLLDQPRNIGGTLAKTALTLAQIFDQVIGENPAGDLQKATTSYGRFESHGKCVLFIFETKGEAPRELPIGLFSTPAQASKITQLFNSFFNDDPRFSQGVKTLVEAQTA